MCSSDLRDLRCAAPIGSVSLLAAAALVEGRFDKTAGVGALLGFFPLALGLLLKRPILYLTKEVRPRGAGLLAKVEAPNFRKSNSASAPQGGDRAGRNSDAVSRLADSDPAILGLG